MFTNNSTFFSSKPCNVQVFPVQPNLSMTPSEIAQCVEKGMPVKAPDDVNGFYEGDTTSGHDLPVEFRRGSDLNDIWNADMDARDHINEGRKAFFLRKKVKEAENE